MNWSVLGVLLSLAFVTNGVVTKGVGLWDCGRRIHSRV